MRPMLLLITAIFMLFNGCATHYYRVKPEGLEIILKMAEAKKVELVCTNELFGIHRARRIDREMWAVTLPSHREFSYFYLVDGAGYLPDCPLRETDDFGSENCIYHPGM